MSLAKSTRSRHPNIILLVGEDTGLHPRCYNNPYASTPNIDRLASQGVRYTTAISTAPVCAPSRSSIITGMYPWSIGTHHMRSTILHPPRLFTHELREAGYYVNWANKTDFNFEPPADFADQRTDWIDDLANNRLPDQPLFLYMNFEITHESTMWNDDETTCWGQFKKRLELQHMLADDQHHDPALAPVPDYLPDTPEVRLCIAKYFDALSIQDAQIGQVLDALAASGKADNTIVIYMTDHGRGLVREKRWCYDAGLHLPLIIRAPGMLEPGGVCDEVVNWTDIAPTILSLAGVPIPNHYQGVAFLGDAKEPARQYAFSGRDRMDEAYDQVRTVRDARWRYIRNTCPQLPYAQCNIYMEISPATPAVRRLWADGKLHGPAALWMSETKPAEELYDALADQQMIHNLADDPQHAATLGRMRAALDAHLAKVGDLGQLSERELIARGIVADRLDEYRKRITALPAEFQIGPPLTLLEMHEAQAYVP